MVRDDIPLKLHQETCITFFRDRAQGRHSYFPPAASYTFILIQKPNGGTSILRGRRGGGGGAWTSHQAWRQNLGQGPAKFTK